MAEDARFLVREQDVLVLVDDVEPGRADLEVAVALRGLFKELVVDVKAENVALVKARVALRAFAVELYALEPYVLLQQRFGQQRHSLAHETVKALPGVVFSNSQLFHK